jgi:histone demethylase JARID1
VPAASFDTFEAAMRAELPELFAANPSLMFQLVTLVPPDALLRRGVPLSRGVQRQGEFIITLPAAYHFGFNAGFNVAEVGSVRACRVFCKLVSFQSSLVCVGRQLCAK